jgi:hypothetical protein
VNKLHKGLQTNEMRCNNDAMKTSARTITNITMNALSKTPDCIFAVGNCKNLVDILSVVTQSGHFVLATKFALTS